MQLHHVASLEAVLPRPHIRCTYPGHLTYCVATASATSPDPDTTAAPTTTRAANKHFILFKLVLDNLCIFSVSRRIQLICVCSEKQLLE